jgi:hypothetical protein
MAPENPLTARVQVNRIWQHYFGNGHYQNVGRFWRAERISRFTASLLDWLAVEFRERAAGV